MTRAVAEHLNKLLGLARPIVERDALEGNYVVVWDSPNGWQVCRDIVDPVWKSVEPEAVAAAIRKAAAERTEAPAFTTSVSGQSPTSCGLYDHCANPIGWELGRDRIRAAIAAHNARTLAEYEAYRVACEQGVAVPPV